jgi:putative transposase
VTEKFEFIDAEYAASGRSGDEYVPSVVKMCRWMEVSRSGFYEWRNAPESATAARRGILALYVKKSFADSGETYGYRRVHADLAGWGVPAGPELVRSLMRELGLKPCQPRPWRFSLTEGDGQAHGIPDLVHRDFTAGAPGEKMVGDITYVPTWQGWLYLATVIDCHTKAVIGWAMDDNYKTPLIEKAIEAAARNYPLAEDAIFHSDRGSNYMSGTFAQTLRKHRGLFREGTKPTRHSGVSKLKTARFPGELSYHTKFSRTRAVTCTIPLDSPGKTSQISA